MEGLMPDVGVRMMFRRHPERTVAQGPRRLAVGMLAGCAQRVFFGDVNAATVRVLAAEGCDVVVPRGAQCCGALSIHAGYEDDGLERARRTIDLFEAQNVDVVVANVAGCGSSMKAYAHLLRDDPEYRDRARAFCAKVRDVSELLDKLPARAERHPIKAKVAYHDACHLANAQHIREQPRRVLATIPDLELVPVAESEVCCGSAGIYNLVQPETAEDLGRRKVERLTAARPDVVATANAGCLLQIRRYIDQGVPVVHPVQLLDASIRGLPAYP
jgi:glycolate oxidase iron-sulfur subunit